MGHKAEQRVAGTQFQGKEAANPPSDRELVANHNPGYAAMLKVKKAGADRKNTSVKVTEITLMNDPIPLRKPRVEQECRVETYLGNSISSKEDLVWDKLLGLT